MNWLGRVIGSETKILMKTKFLRSTLWVAVISVALPQAIYSAELEQPEPAAAVPATEVTSPAAPDYFFPDLPSQALVYDGNRFVIKPIIALVGDYTGFNQDDASLDQVGEQEDTFDLRAARIGVSLRSKSERAWGFTFTTDYQEQRTRSDATWQIYDLKLDVPVGPVTLTAGKQKEPFAYEMVGLMPQLPTQERILNPFFVTRNTGLKLGGQLGGGRF
jgi:phosphate-selective porin OprO and OprP